MSSGIAPNSLTQIPVRAAGKFFRWIELSAAQIDLGRDAIARILTGELQAVIVHDVYTPAEMVTVVERLERHDPPFFQTWFPDEFRAFFYGENLNLAHPDLEDYFHRAPLFAQQLDELFPPGKRLRDYLAPLLGRLDGGRTCVAPPGPRAGQAYQWTTIRAHLTGGFIPPHFDNEQAMRPSYAHLITQVAPHLLSFVLTLGMPTQGGALRIYDLCSPTLAQQVMNDDYAEPLPLNLEQLESVTIRLPAGSMIVVDSGKFLHEVTPVIGHATRWTVCSFFARSADQSCLFAWG